MSSTTVKNLILSQPRIGQTEGTTTPVLKQTTTTVGDKTVVEIEIPGVDPTSVDVNCDNSTLFVSCSKGEVIIPLHPTCDTSAINAEIMWGMLTLTIPMPVTPPAHSIKVSVHDAPKRATHKHEKELTAAE
jgi:HSP20 family molecular chaperone IbpA